MKITEEKKKQKKAFLRTEIHEKETLKYGRKSKQFYQKSNLLNEEREGKEGKNTVELMSEETRLTLFLELVNDQFRFRKPKVRQTKNEILVYTHQSEIAEHQRQIQNHK